MPLVGITFIPLFGALTIFLIRRDNRQALEFWGLFVSGITFLFALGLFTGFGDGYAEIKFDFIRDWIPNLGISFHMGIDGISLWMVLLTAFLTPIIIYYSAGSIDKNFREFTAFLLALETALIGVFCSLDLVLFYVFWEAMLIPMYFLIGIWGAERRVYSAIKFFLFTMFGGVLMLIGILVLHKAAAQTGIMTFDLIELTEVAQTLPPKLSGILFWCFFLAFAIKIPLFPFHTWLPDAHTDAPTAGSVILAGVLLKMGTYGFLRFSLPLFPQESMDYALIISVLAIIGILYAAWVATVQPDMKRLIAYSSVSHLGYSVLGIFSFTIEGMTGGLIHMVNHGLSTGALFLIVGFLYYRTHTKKIADYGGIARVMPMLSVCFLIAMFASVGLPLLNGFVGEFLVLVGSAKAAHNATFPGANIWLTVLAATGVIWGAVYMLWMFQRVMLGPITNEKNKELKDLDKRELVCLVPILALCVIIGIFPTLLTKPMEAPLQKIIDHVNSSELQSANDVNIPAEISHLEIGEFTPARGGDDN